jgi:hypothetical protein
MAGKYIVDYIRQSQSANSLRFALAEIAGLFITPQESMLKNVYAQQYTRVYAFEDFSVTVEYPHEELVPGTNYPAQTIIGGEHIRVYSQQDAASSAQWWRVLDWTNGLPLYKPFAGLVIPDRKLRFYWVSNWTDSEGNTRKHIRADFDNSMPDLQDRFWNNVHASEERTETTLADFPALSTVASGQNAYANMLDLYFNLLLGPRGIVLDLNTATLGDTADRAVRNFAVRETPIGSRLIIRTGGQEIFA